MNFHLQAAGSDDESFLRELFFEVRSPEFAGLPAATVGPLLEMQQRAQLRGYAEKFPAAVNEIVWIEGERAGRLLVSTTAEEIHLVDVALLGRFRGQGVGTELVEELCRKARAANLPLRLSVQAGNPARRLYERCGFGAIGGDGMYVAMELGAKAQQPTPHPSAAAETAPGVPTESVLTQAYFQSLLGKTVGMRTFAGVETVLTVVDVQPLVVGRAPSAAQGDSFRVDFTGPLEPILPPETAEMTVPGQPPELMFVSALGPRDGAMLYEAIFNRMQSPL